MERKSELDISGKRFGRLVAIKKDGYKNESVMWLCKCDCGKEKRISIYSLLKGYTKSCGCLALEEKRNRIKHGGARNTGYERLYLVWLDMKDRCYNPNCKSYNRYGGNGISVCQEWVNDYSAFKSWAYDNGYNENANKYECTIDRIDNQKGYSPENCRWVNAQIQANNRRTSVKYEYNGEQHTLYEWSKILDIDIKLVRERIASGWSFERSISTKFNPSKEYVYKSKSYSIKELSQLSNIRQGTIRSRLSKGWSVEETLERPVQVKHHKNI